MLHPRDLLGQQVDHYLIETHLATGGMAEVYLAQDTWLDRLTVLKMLKSSLVDEADHRIRFQREAQAIAQLPHPHIVEIYNIGTLPDKRPYFTMPYLAGGSLAAWLQRQNGVPMAPQHAFTLCRHIADALETAHQAGVVHRDLKPANILLRGPLDPVVTDFGIAALSQRSVQLTQPGMFLGTYLYASPEQKMGQPVDHRSDIYSLGVILFELLTGTLPYAQKRPFDQLQETQPGFPTFVCELVDRCLQMQPADRYSAAAALRRDLDSALAGVTETRPTPVDKPAPSTRWLKLLIPVVALLAIVAGYVVFVNRSAGVNETTVSIPPAPTPVNVVAPTNQVVIVAVTSTLAPAIIVDMPSTETPTPTSTETEAATETETAVPTQIPTPMLIPVPLPVPASTPPVGRIVFTCYIEEIDQLCTVNADGSDYTQITDAPATDFYASFMPGDGRILFSSRREGAFLLYDMNPDGSDVRRIGPSDQGSLFGPAGSPDGQRIAFASILGSNHAIWIMNRDGTGLTRLLSSDVHFFVDPTWSPDGTQIMFSSTLDGPASHYIINVDGTNLQRLNVSVDELGGRNDWRPDGEWFAFYAGSSKERQIYLAALDGSAVYQLTNRSSNLAPSFSPDGNWIVFTSYLDGDGEIFIMRIDGSDVRQLTHNNYTDWQPRWQR